MNWHGEIVFLCGSGNEVSGFTKDGEYLRRLLPYVGAPPHDRLMSMHPLSDKRCQSSNKNLFWSQEVVLLRMVCVGSTYGF